MAKTRGAARRFKVDEEQFERKMILLSGNETQAKLSSPGFHKVYFSPGLGNEVFAVEFNTWTVAAKTDDGMIKRFLHSTRMMWNVSRYRESPWNAKTASGRSRIVQRRNKPTTKQAAPCLAN